MVELADKYAITSNRESSKNESCPFGRYDVMLGPKASGGSAAINNGIIMEFKVQDDDEKELADTVRAALRQTETKNYQSNLIAKGIPEERIRKNGFAFCGKKALIGSGK